MRTLIIILTLFTCFTGRAQQEVDVVTGASYMFEVYYDLDSGTRVTADRIAWDIAFSTHNESSTILANNGKELNVYTYPIDDTAGWDRVDVDLIEDWTPQYNSLESWQNGAFNRNRIANNPDDAGWGMFHQETNTIEGDSIYIIQYLTGEIKKLWIEEKNIENNVWKFRYANTDGSNEIFAEINANNYDSMHMVHYSMLNDTIITREPPKNAWDLYFNVFWDYTIPYKLNGVWQNRHIAVQEVQGVEQPTFTSYETDKFSHVVSTIGGDWKTYNPAMMMYELSDSTVYFIKDTIQAQESPIYKIYFTFFGGMTSGVYGFIQEEISPNGIIPYKLKTATVYPNPANRFIHIIYDVKGNGILKVIDINGKIAIQKNIKPAGTLNREYLDIQQLPAGQYQVLIETDEGVAGSRFIKLK